MNSNMDPVHFLLVDDLEENLVALEALLRRDDLVQLKARSGEEALELLLRHDVALALLDVQMPGIDGFELAELLRGNARTRHIPIIFLTAGSADRQRRFRGYEAGAVDFIQKPLEADILRSKANVFFDIYRQRQQIAAQRDELEIQTETLKAFEQLTRQQLVQEQEIARFREQFIAVLGHDLRNPLASIGGGARVLRRQSLNDKALKIIDLMEASVDRMAELIDNVMDFARGRLGGGIALDRQPTELDPVLRHVVNELQASEPDRKMMCTFALPTPICVDPGRIGQLASNLLANAVVHGDPRSPIELRAVLEDGEFILSVRNAGPKIPEAAMERLFQPFVRGEVRPNQRGLGLGLHIASEIAKAHGGTLSVTSTEGETRFTFTMPAEQELETAE
ncbi:MAG TPA: hybrid sensor histidine kinase/response regulator [Sphingopyxis sp.]|nr:hybrid sensor histidine kinase/response regulator [Sphingopyxis sp.]